MIGMHTTEIQLEERIISARLLRGLFETGWRVSKQADQL